MKRIFHFHLLSGQMATVVPIGVGSTSDAGKIERPAAESKPLIHYINLCLNGAIGYVAVTLIRALIYHVKIDVDHATGYIRSRQLPSLHSGLFRLKVFFLSSDPSRIVIGAAIVLLF